MWSAAAVAVAVLTAGAASARDEAATHFCAKTGSMQFRAADGTRLSGHRFGRGTTAVIFAHELRGASCNWIPYARGLASKGFLTIAFDFRGYGDSQQRSGAAAFRLGADVTAAARVARSLGAKKVFLVGASMGGTAVLVAGVNARPTVDGVIALSAPSTISRMDGVAAARRLQVPVLYIAGEGDDPFDDDSRALYEATASSAKSLEILDSAYHGTQFVRYDAVGKTLIERFIASR
jgi:pimeloyl-ACP methyl ester carboxylesterase